MQEKAGEEQFQREGLLGLDLRYFDFKKSIDNFIRRSDGAVNKKQRQNFDSVLQFLHLLYAVSKY